MSNSATPSKIAPAGARMLARADAGAHSIRGGHRSTLKPHGPLVNRVHPRDRARYSSLRIPCKFVPCEFNSPPSLCATRRRLKSKPLCTSRQSSSTASSRTRRARRSPDSIRSSTPSPVSMAAASPTSSTPSASCWASPTCRRCGAGAPRSRPPRARAGACYVTDAGRPWGAWRPAAMRRRRAAAAPPAARARRRRDDGAGCSDASHCTLRGLD